MVTRVQTEDEKYAARIQAYAEAFDFFIEEPEAVSDHTLKIFLDYFKQRAEQERERQAKDPGTQKLLYAHKRS